MYIVGIDVGSNGACTIYNSEDNSYMNIKPIQYPSVFRLFVHTNIVVYIEHLHAFPNMSSSSVWKMAENQGYVIGLLEALEIPYVFITASEWQKNLTVPKKLTYKERKDYLLVKAKELFPDKPVFLYSADSWLICKYAIEKLNIS